MLGLLIRVPAFLLPACSVCTSLFVRPPGLMSPCMLTCCWLTDGRVAGCQDRKQAVVSVTSSAHARVSLAVRIPCVSCRADVQPLHSVVREKISRHTRD